MEHTKLFAAGPLSAFNDQPAADPLTGSSSNGDAHEIDRDRTAVELPSNPPPSEEAPAEINDNHATVDNPVPTRTLARSGASSLRDTDQVAVSASEPDPGDLIDFRRLADYLGFVAGSIRRHWILGAAIWILTVAAIGVGASMWPKTYHVQAKLLAQRNAVMTALSNPGRAIPWDADAPTRSAAETVLRNDNLVSLIKQTNLMERWTQNRAPVLKLKDSLRRWLSRDGRSDEEKLDAMVGLLESRLTVTTGSALEGTVTIDVLWPDPQLAYELVEAAQQAFLEKRQLGETSAINESIEILEKYSSTLHQQMSQTVTELQQAQAQRSSSPRTPVRVGTARVPAVQLPPAVESILGLLPGGAPGLEVDPALARINSAIATKRQEIRSVAELRERQVADLQTRLAQLRLVYTDSHPSVLDVQQSLTALMRESPQLLALRAEEQRLGAESEKQQAAAAILQGDDSRTPRRSAPGSASSEKGALDQPARPREAEFPAAEVIERRPPSRDEATVDYATLRFRLQLNQVQSVLDRIDGARIELAVSQAAFKYRYTVLRPAKVPREPLKPNVGAILAAGTVGAFGLALMAVVGMDLRSRRILEIWQVERQLRLPALGVMRKM